VAVFVAIDTATRSREGSAHCRRVRPGGREGSPRRSVDYRFDCREHASRDARTARAGTREVVVDSSGRAATMINCEAFSGLPEASKPAWRECHAQDQSGVRATVRLDLSTSCQGQGGKSRGGSPTASTRPEGAKPRSKTGPREVCEDQQFARRNFVVGTARGGRGTQSPQVAAPLREEPRQDHHLLETGPDPDRAPPSGVLAASRRMPRIT
jgi:hypothetical protein